MRKPSRMSQSGFHLGCPGSLLARSVSKVVWRREDPCGPLAFAGGPHSLTLRVIMMARAFVVGATHE
jgi:hypothetical protein